MRLTRIVVVAAITAAMFCAASTSFAQPIAVANHSFELDPAAPGCFEVGFIPQGWSLYDPNGLSGGGNFFGVLMASALAAPKMASALKADSLGFLSIEGLYQAVLGESRNDQSPQLADHYFTGEYTTRLLDHERAASDKDRQLSLLVDA